MVLHRYPSSHRGLPGNPGFLTAPRQTPHRHKRGHITLRGSLKDERVPREAVESPSLEIFKTRLDKVLCSLL